MCISSHATDGSTVRNSLALFLGSSTMHLVTYREPSLVVYEYLSLDYCSVASLILNSAPSEFAFQLSYNYDNTKTIY